MLEDTDTSPTNPSWLDRPLTSLMRINLEKIIFAVIILAAVVTRFYDLGTRVMSHDETSHVYWSWLYEQGNGYSHDPVTHGPFQFHVVALTYFIFGASDFTARIPAALFSIASVGFLWYFRRFLGRAGAAIGAVLLLISPYMLYYGRYVRNEAFVGLFGLLMIWAMLSYFESGKPANLVWLTIAAALHFTTKETSFIYQAQALIFLAIFLVVKITNQEWKKPQFRRLFIFTLIAAVLFTLVILIIQSAGEVTTILSGSDVASPAVPGQQTGGEVERTSNLIQILILSGVIGSLGAAVVFAIIGYGWENLRRERAFDMAIVLGTMVLPMLAPFPVKLLGFDPIEYTNSQSILITTIFVIILALMAIAVGVLWNWRLWLVLAAIFYAIFTVLYTSVFTNGFGFITGLVGSLGYWLDQQGVNRGSQPFYYYALLQVPIYEFLPALGSIAALFYAAAKGIGKKALYNTAQSLTFHEDPGEEISEAQIPTPIPVLPLLGFWSLTSLLAYSIAGEKMPWLTVHITLPMILTSAWYLGKLVDSINWVEFSKRRGIIVLILLPVFFLSTLAGISSLLGATPPFQGSELNQLQSTSTFITSLLFAVLSGYAIARTAGPWEPTLLYRVFGVAAFAFLAVLTARAAFRAAYINYDNATEYLVYAHMARGPKEALEQIEEISRRTTNGLALRVAYDDDTTYPYWWYLRDYTNKDFFGPNPTRAQRDAAVILVGDNNFSKIEPVVGQAYHMFEYTRIWWPNQDYFNLTWDRIKNSLMDAKMRAAIYDIWMNRDYTRYSEITTQDLSLPNWQPSHKMRLYIRKDIISSLWNYGISPAPEEVIADPYEGKGIDLQADQTIGSAGSEPGQFNRPRGIALAADGSVYVADTENHRIQHIAPDGTVIRTWGQFSASIENSNALPGMFNEPWGIAVGPDGSVYVADTWNHRIQKFTAEGEFITSWGFGISQTEDPLGFYGPRSVAVNDQGHVFVSDTGNKRIVVFDSNGSFITKFGQPGLSPGEFDEPVGLAVDNQGMLYVADTWNQRIQVFAPLSDNSYTPLLQWDVVGWYGQSLDNKPYIAVNNNGDIFAADPEGYRILQFDSQGTFIRYWGTFSAGVDGFDLPGAVAADDFGVWVSDTNNNRVLHFTLPASP